MKGIPVLANGDPVTTTFVVAENFRQFLNWCRYSKVNPRGRIRYLDQHQDLHGFFDIDVVFTGTGYISPETMAILRTRGVRTWHNQYESAEIEPNIISNSGEK